MIDNCFIFYNFLKVQMLKLILAYYYFHMILFCTDKVYCRCLALMDVFLLHVLLLYVLLQ